MANRDPLLQEREKTHGSFKLNAQIHKKLCYAYPHEPDLNTEQRLALNMIYLKIARILSGQGDHKDHWDDIAGYAKLGSEACE